jgi:hypothetical protein
MAAAVGMTLPFAGRLCPFMGNGKYDLCTMVAASVPLTEAGWFEGMVAAGAVSPVALDFCTKGANTPIPESAKGACVANGPEFETLCEKQGFTEVSCPKDKCHWNTDSSQYEACVAVPAGAVAPADGKLQFEIPAGTTPGATGTWCPKTALDAGDESKCVARVANIGLPTTEEGYFEMLVGKDAVAVGPGLFCAKKTGEAGGTGGTGGDNRHLFCGAGTEWNGSTCQATADGMMAACKKVSSRGYKRRSVGVGLAVSRRDCEKRVRGCERTRKNRDRDGSRQEHTEKER